MTVTKHDSNVTGMSAAEAILEYLSTNPKAATDDVVASLTPMWAPGTLRNTLYELQQKGLVKAESQFRPPNLWSLVKDKT